MPLNTKPRGVLKPMRFTGREEVLACKLAPNSYEPHTCQACGCSIPVHVPRIIIIGSYGPWMRWNNLFSLCKRCGYVQAAIVERATRKRGKRA